MFNYNTDPIVEMQRAHQQSVQHAAHLQYLARIIRRRSNQRKKTTDTIRVSCTILPTDC